MRVLMVSKACIVGIYQRKLEYIAQAGVDLTVIVSPSWKDERGEQPLERIYTDGYDLRVLPIRFNGNFHLHHYVGLGHVMRDTQADIVHIDEEPYNLATWQTLYHAKRQGAKSLFFSWQNIYRQYPPPFAWGEKWVMANIDYALMGTDSADDVWREKGYTKPAQTIPQFGTDIDLFQPQPRPNRPFTIGYIGRLVEEKGVYDLLDAVMALQGEWRLCFVGGGTLEDALKAKVHELGVSDRVEFIGQIPSTDMPKQYHEMDVLVLPSRTRPNWKEQFGRVIIEAMASGIPVIGSDSGAIPSVISDAGLIFSEGDAIQLRDSLQQLRDDTNLYDSCVQKGIQRAHTFSHQAIAEQTVAVYKTMMGEV